MTDTPATRTYRVLHPLVGTEIVKAIFFEVDAFGVSFFDEKDTDVIAHHVAHPCVVIDITERAA